jgi:hypothetical protein
MKKIAEIKKAMIEFEDFYGGDLLNISDVPKAKSKKELAEIIDRHSAHMESMLSDALRHIDNFKKNLRL